MTLLLRSLLVFLLVVGVVLPAAAQPESETDGRDVTRVTMDMSTASMMRARPFVLPNRVSPAFEFEQLAETPISEDAARQALARFLELRNLPSDRVAAALTTFADPTIVAVIPAPNLRAALLMLTDWDPYRVTIDAILLGDHESGHPFELVDFRTLEFGAAIATLQIAYSTGVPRLLLNDRYRNESPQQLIPVLIHESMHDGVDNSFEEELIAGLLDSLAYAEVLSIDPAAANTGTELAAYNNVQLFALMNSIGRRGAGYVGVLTSLDGDAYVGPGLETFDADSISAGIASDAWYAQLPRGGSNGGSVLAALLRRFPESASLATLTRFSEEAIAVIDRGIGLVLTPRKVRAIAVDLELSLAIDRPLAASSAVGKLSLESMPARPFLPTDLLLFDLHAMRPAAVPIDAEFARAALREVMLRSGQDAATVSQAIAGFDDPAVKAVVPEPELRAALLMLHRAPRWSALLASALEGANGNGAPVRIAYRDLPDAVPAIWDTSPVEGAPVVWINSILHGERPELLATAIVEGLLLESGVGNASHAVIAAALATLLWADLVIADPSLTSGSTWGVITRNRDLLALLNSQPFDPGDPASTAIGLKLAAAQSGDVLPLLTRSAGSFVDYVRYSPRVPASPPGASSLVPAVMTELLRSSGLTLPPAAGAQALDDDVLAAVDVGFVQLFPAEMAIEAATVLGLTVAAGNS